MRVCRIVTVPITFSTLLRLQVKQILESGIDLTLVSSPGPELDEICRSVPVRCYPIRLARTPFPREDMVSLAKLFRFFFQERFDIVHSSTPKAGLLTALAGAAARVDIRMHTYTGQVWTELRGPKRWVTRKSDRLIGRLDTHLYADSHSQRDFLISERIVPSGKINVLGAGSISGVDLRRFDPAIMAQSRANMRTQLGVAQQSVVIVFVGRVTKDKGIIELIGAFQRLRAKYDEIDLVIVGPLEPERDPLPPEILTRIAMDSHIHMVGFVSQPEQYFALADIFCLPSYREGFGSVAIEAGALCLPTVATRVTGLVDAVVDGVTGILVPPKDEGSLARSLETLIDAPDLRVRMGQAARQRAVSHFDTAVVNQSVVDEYIRLAGSRIGVSLKE